MIPWNQRERGPCKRETSLFCSTRIGGLSESGMWRSKHGGHETPWRGMRQYSLHLCKKRRRCGATIRWGGKSYCQLRIATTNCISATIRAASNARYSHRKAEATRYQRLQTPTACFYAARWVVPSLNIGDMATWRELKANCVVNRVRAETGNDQGGPTTVTIRAYPPKQ